MVEKNTRNIAFRNLTCGTSTKLLILTVPSDKITAFLQIKCK